MLISDKKTNAENPRDYPVPNFGIDRDIKWTDESLNVA
jgi:hypothetical protein